MNFTKFLIKLFKKELFQNINLAHKIEYKSVEEIKKIQENKFIKLINHAKENVPYYFKKLEGVKSLEDIDKIDFLTKTDILENKKLLKAKNIPLYRFVEDSTSGSTGSSLYYYRDRKEHYRKAVGYRCDSRAGYKIGKKVLYLWGADRDILKERSFYVKIKDKYIHKERKLSTYHMTEKDLKNYSKILNQFKPQTIVAYPTPLFYFAQYIELNDIKIWQLEGIICSAETLFPFQREKIEKVFNCKVFNRYGCREVGNIASECKAHNGLHINSDHIILEIIDKNGQRCKPGELGEIVVTNLDELTFPLIRYKIGDIGAFSNKKCTCGINLPLLERMEGRVFDLIVGVNGNIVGGTFWTLLKHKISGWSKFQVIQEKKDSVEIVVEDNIEIKEDFKEKLTKIVSKKLGKEMNIKIDIVKEIPLTKTGKHRWIISKISPYAK